MPTAEKQAVLNEITENLKNANGVYIAKYTGMSVADANELRGVFRKGNIFYKVYKNKLMKLAMEEIGGYDKVFPSLVDQNAFAFVEDELSAPAKVLKEFAKDKKKPEFKGAFASVTAAVAGALVSCSFSPQPTRPSASAILAAVSVTFFMRFPYLSYS